MNTAVSDSARFAFWVNIFGTEYYGWDKGKRMQMKKDYADKLGVMVHQVSPHYVTPITLGDCKPATPAPCLQSAIVAGRQCGKTVNWAQVYEDRPEAINKKKEETMYANMNATVGDEHAQKRDYLRRRLSDSFDTKRVEARVHFKLDVEEPKSPKEAVERIKAGLFSFNDDYVKDNGEWKNKGETWRTAVDYISWRTTEADREGYDAFLETLEPAKTKAEDVIRVLDPADGLKALQEFESTTFH